MISKDKSSREHFLFVFFLLNIFKLLTMIVDGFIWSFVDFSLRPSWGVFLAGAEIHIRRD